MKVNIMIFPKAKIGENFTPDAVLTFQSEADFKQWRYRVLALPFAKSELGSREFWIVQGRIIEVRIQPKKPQQFSGSVIVSGDLPREIRKFLDEDHGK